MPNINEIKEVEQRLSIITKALKESEERRKRLAIYKHSLLLARVQAREQLDIFRKLTNNGKEYPNCLTYHNNDVKLFNYIVNKANEYNDYADNDDKILFIVGTDRMGRNTISTDDRGMEAFRKFRMQYAVEVGGYVSEIPTDKFNNLAKNNKITTLYNLSESQYNYIKSKTWGNKNDFSFTATQNNDGTYNITVLAKNYISNSRRETKDDIFSALVSEKVGNTDIKRLSQEYTLNLEKEILDYNKDTPMYVVDVANKGPYLIVEKDKITVKNSKDGDVILPKNSKDEKELKDFMTDALKFYSNMGAPAKLDEYSIKQIKDRAPNGDVEDYLNTHSMTGNDTDFKFNIDINPYNLQDVNITTEQALEFLELLENSTDLKTIFNEAQLEVIKDFKENVPAVTLAENPDCVKYLLNSNLSAEQMEQIKDAIIINNLSSKQLELLSHPEIKVDNMIEMRSLLGGRIASTEEIALLSNPELQTDDREFQGMIYAIAPEYVKHGYEYVISETNDSKEKEEYQKELDATIRVSEKYKDTVTLTRAKMESIRPIDNDINSFRESFAKQYAQEVGTILTKNETKEYVEHYHDLVKDVLKDYGISYEDTKKIIEDFDQNLENSFILENGPNLIVYKQDTIAYDTLKEALLSDEVKINETDIDRMLNDFSYDSKNNKKTISEEKHIENLQNAAKQVSDMVMVKDTSSFSKNFTKLISRAEAAELIGGINNKEDLLKSTEKAVNEIAQANIETIYLSANEDLLEHIVSKSELNETQKEQFNHTNSDIDSKAEAKSNVEMDYHSNVDTLYTTKYDKKGDTVYKDETIEERER